MPTPLMTPIYLPKST